MKIETRAIDSLRPDSRNARKHGARNLATIRASLEQFGQRRAAVVRSDGTVLAGNGMLEAARALGWSELSVTVVPDEWSDEEARAYALADNRTGELAEWDVAVLDEHLVELEVAGLDIEALGFEPPKREQVEVEEDEVPETPVEPVTVVGDLWQVGPHRIICGDSSDPAVLDRLLAGVKVGCVLTDPPYGINLDTDYASYQGNVTKSGKGSGKVKPNTYRAVINDDRPFDGSFLRVYFQKTKEQFWFGANYFRRTLSDNDMDGSWLVWDKRPVAWTEEGKGADKVFGSVFELLWSAEKHQQSVLRHQWSGFTARNREVERAHPTEKPIVMLAEILERWAPKACAVADPFAGSGTTLLAAARTGRVGFGAELDPAYVDVIVARLERETGETAVRVDG
jgi:DNA modification methylase